jgi:hypothetical protein
VILPEKLVTIEDGAFENSGIKEITFRGKIPSIGNNIFKNVKYFY